MSVYPTGIPAAGSAVSTDTLAAAGHTALHNNMENEIVALATKLGTGASTPSSGTVLRGTASGVTSYGQVDLSTDVTNVLPVARGGTQSQTSTGTGNMVLSTSPTLTNPTLTTPTIADFTNAQHTHGSAAQGGSSLGATTHTSITTNTISSNGANHITLSAGSSKLVKTTVLRQDDTTNTYQSGNTVMLSGWGVITPGASAVASEAVNFGVTFTQNPIVILTSGGDSVAGTTYGSGGANIKDSIVPEAIGVLTTGFTARLQARDNTNWAAGNTVFYQWLAFGEI